jgi:hypothetical protein
VIADRPRTDQGRSFEATNERVGGERGWAESFVKVDALLA